ncbi:glycosyltransferase family 2 protein [Halobacteriales archaeon SW_6_65_46]|nr:MAG: glycosyltransferase family 2 protein [Halobacteriales archaeon SW_6_65_46]
MTQTVSVIIPTYERPSFLRGAIETVLGQTHDDIEVVVVDDGSSESYAEKLVSNYSETVTCLCHDENQGLSAARNTGVRESSGKYVAFLDDDDRWHQTKLARQIKALESDNQAGLATCLVAAVTPNNEPVHRESTAPSDDCSDDILVSNQIGTPSRVVVRRKCFDDIGMFDESLRTKQDWDFYLRLCQEWNVVAVEDHLCFRTVHESMSSSATALKRDKKSILSKHEELIRERGKWEQAQTAVAAEVARSHLGSGELRKARDYSRQACSEVTPRHLLLHMLTYTHPLVVHVAIIVKRILLQKLYNCGQMNTPHSIK